MRYVNLREVSANRLREVVFAWNYLEWGGAQMYFLGIARRIKDRCRVRFVMPAGTDPQFLDFCRRDGVAVELIDLAADLGPASGLKRKFEVHRNKIVVEREFIRHLRAIQSPGTVLHVELSPWQSMAAIRKLARRGPVFATMHNRLPRMSVFREAIWRAKFRAASKLENFRLFPSNRDALESLRPLAPASFVERALVTYTNVNPDEVSEAEATGDRETERAKRGLDQGFLIVTVGQFIDRKGRRETLAAAKLLKDKGIAASFVWVTNTSIGPADNELIVAHGLGETFRLVRSADIGPAHIDLMRFLKVADAFVLASHVEGLPISLLEAMSLGIASISTDVNAIPEAIVNESTGLLVPPGNAPAIAAAIERLIEDDTLRARIGAAGKAKVLAEFSETEVAEVALDAYVEAANTNG